MLELTQCLSRSRVGTGETTISPQGIWKAASHSSEIRMHPEGRHFVVGNRGHDSIAVYEVCQVTGQITQEITPSGGELQLQLDSGWKYLVVGNQTRARCVLSFDSKQPELLHTALGITRRTTCIPYRAPPPRAPSAERHPPRLKERKETSRRQKKKKGSSWRQGVHLCGSDEKKN